MLITIRREGTTPNLFAYMEILFLTCSLVISCYTMKKLLMHPNPSEVTPEAEF